MDHEASGCVVCGVTGVPGDAGGAPLCDAHAAAIARADVTEEHLASRARTGVAALIGPGGVVLPIGDGGAVIGRDADACDVVVLHATVSAVHARIACSGGVWTVSDADSLNGTSIESARIANGAAAAATPFGSMTRGAAPIASGARLRVGAVSCYFVVVPLAPRPRRARRATQPIAVRVHVASAGGAIELSTRGSGGVARGPGGSVELTARELDLVRTLAARRMESIDPEWAYVASRELAGALGFRSIDPGGDNVRELVCRVRKKLASVGGAGVVQSKPNVGYRIGAEVRAA